MSETLEQLKQEATELGISFNQKIGEVKLQEKIDAYYETQEKVDKSDAVVITDEPVIDEEVDSSTVIKGKKSMSMLAKELYDKAKKTRVVTIIDNDQRVNNQTTTCKANWSNAYYDMGTRIFPLNIPIEIPQGFINVLKEVQIPHHTKDPKNGLSVTTMRPRYSITEENMRID